MKLFKVDDSIFGNCLFFENRELECLLFKINGYFYAGRTKHQWNKYEGTYYL